MASKKQSGPERNCGCSDKILGHFVIAFCIIALLVCSCIWFYYTFANPPRINKVEIKFISSDSLLNKNYITGEQADSLISLMNRHEAEIADKYQYFIEQKYNEDKYFSIFTVLLGVIFSLFGFFGYKTMSSIEEKAIKTAQDKADDIAKSVADKVAREYMERNVSTYVGEASETLFNSKAAETLKMNLKESLYSELETRLTQLVEEHSSEDSNNSNYGETDSSDDTAKDGQSSNSLFS
jgi:hypothetical protein